MTLEDFVAKTMTMSGVYQPVVLRTLIENGGEATTRDIAVAICAVDAARIAYYERILKRYPRETLAKNHGVVEVEGNRWRLVADVMDSDALLEELTALIDKWVEDRPDSFRGWVDEGAVPSGTRYAVIKAHDGACAACGLTAADGVALDVDHIIPKSKGGSNEVENLQVLCAPCNRGKRDTDEADWRSYEVKKRLGLVAD